MKQIPEGFRYGCLRALKPCDADGMLEWMHEDDIASVFQHDFKATTLKDVTRFIESSHSAVDEIHLAVASEVDEYMGTISLKNIDKTNGSAEYAIAMRSLAHGSGLSKKATEDILHFAFKQMGLHRVYLCVRADNIRAKRFYEKVGFAYEGSSKDALRIGAAWYDLDWYAVVETSGATRAAQRSLISSEER